MRNGILFFFAAICFYSCSTSRQMAKNARKDLLNDPALQAAHVGICIFDPATGKYVYDYQGDKYFVPASNTKLPTCYAAMKYLGDSLVGLKYEAIDDSTIVLYATGDPSFLHEDFKRQPVMDFLKSQKKHYYLNTALWQEQSLGSGWAWSDYESDYMAERSPFPVHGNVVDIKLRQAVPASLGNGRHILQLKWTTDPSFFENVLPNSFILPLKEEGKTENRDSLTEIRNLYHFSPGRALGGNQFSLDYSNSGFKSARLSFATSDSMLSEILKHDSLIVKTGKTFSPGNLSVIYSQPTDSVLRPMMHWSNNFFAEQMLLMVSNQRLGIMNDARIIDTLLKTDFRDLPQKPNWVDGCGLSRYDLFSPRDLVFILNRMRTDFGMERIKTILATGNEGTLQNYYKADSGFIYAKTGTLSGVVALSGFLYTRQNKLLIFSILVNNHNSSASAVRRRIERFLESLR